MKQENETRRVDWSRAGVEPHLQEIVEDSIFHLLLRRDRLTTSDVLEVVRGTGSGIPPIPPWEIIAMLYSVGDITGYALQATDGQIGSLRDLYFDDSSSAVRYLVIDTGEWLPGRQVLLAPAGIGAIDADRREIITGLTRQQVKDSPGIDSEKPVSRQEEEALHTYFGWQPYWAMPPLAAGLAPWWGTTMPPADAAESSEARLARDVAAAEEAQHDPHLRSAREVSGYDVQATDGDIGRIEDLLVDEGRWMIDLLVIDTGNWLPGRKVVISPRSMRAVDWTEQRIKVDLPRESIEHSPGYKPPVDQNFLMRLFDHYGLTRQT